MRSGLYLRLAISNIRRDKKTYLPHMLASAVIFGAFLLICGLLTTDSLQNTPNGPTAQTMFAFGMAVFAVFAVFFMCYINRFLIGRRKKEFGLYGVLGLEKRHIGRVLVWENLFTLLSGLLIGTALTLVFGRLLFLVLLKLIRTAAGSVFHIPLQAYIITGGLFLVTFIITSVSNVLQVSVQSPMQLLHSDKKGEKESKLLVPVAIAGLLLLSFAYICAWTQELPGVALGVFFPLAILVIIATFLLFSSGSVAFLKLLRKNKSIYYRPGNFIAIAGMTQRMKQNARSLAAICILSTMLVVTVSGTLALYLGQEDILKTEYVYDVSLGAGYYEEETVDETGETVMETPEGDVMERVVPAVRELAKKAGVTLSGDVGKLRYHAEGEDAVWSNASYVDGAVITRYGDMIGRDGNELVFDVSGSEEDCLRFVSSLPEMSDDSLWCYCSDVFSARQSSYAAYGGLVFLGALFGLLFLAVTVLIIYFKQISEGYEDAGQFEILQKVGMDDAQVRSTINTQVLWVFFVPLFMTVLHMVFASKIMARMLESFRLFNWSLTIMCIAGVCAVFAILYLAVYKLTAKAYYAIVKR